MTQEWYALNKSINVIRGVFNPADRSSNVFLCFLCLNTFSNR
jgi:hypothetical protein